MKCLGAKILAELLIRTCSLINLASRPGSILRTAKESQECGDDLKYGWSQGSLVAEDSVLPALETILSIKADGLIFTLLGISRAIHRLAPLYAVVSLCSPFLCFFLPGAHSEIASYHI